MTDTARPIPTFATNDPLSGGKVSTAVNDLLSAGLTMGETVQAAISAPYFNPQGFNLIAGALERYGDRVRLLLGVPPSPPDPTSEGLSSSGKDPYGPATSQFDAWQREQASLAGQSLGPLRHAERLVAWLSDTDVQVRILKQKFLHGKAFIVDHPAMPSALAGSSNLTVGGMQRNAELNLGVATQQAASVRDWFNARWDESEDFKQQLLDLYAPLFEPWTPREIWLRMLIACYPSQPEALAAELLWYQRTAVPRLIAMIDRYGGALLADETGLGKTHIAGALATRSLVDRCPVLVLCPASVQPVWREWQKSSLRQQSPMVRRRFYIRSYDKFRSDVDRAVAETEDGDRQTALSPDEMRQQLQRTLDYADAGLVICDEGHMLRNVGRKARLALRALMTVGPDRKDVLLSTATPVNNRLADLSNLLSLFINRDDAFNSIGVESWRDEFLDVTDHLKGIHEAATLDDTFQRSGRLDRVLEQVTVRRSRTAVQHAMQSSEEDRTVQAPDGQHTLIEFPQVIHRDATEWAMSDAQNRCVDGICDLLAPDPDPGSAHDNRFRLPFYNIDAYREDNPSSSGSTRLALLRSLLLKRTDSSPVAMVQSLRHLQDTAYKCLEHLDDDNALLLTVTQLLNPQQSNRTWPASDAASESEDADPIVTLFNWRDLDMDQDTDPDERRKTDYNIDKMRSELRHDISLLEDLMQEDWVAECARVADWTMQCMAASPQSEEALSPVGSVMDWDLKFRCLVDRLADIASSAPAGSDPNLRKVLIFSEFADTAHYLNAALCAAIRDDARLEGYEGRLAPTVHGGSTARPSVVKDFAPETSGDTNCAGSERYGRYDILVSTDVLAEGLNLQQAGKVINYDMPWNPMRVVQRIGRVDRLGSLTGQVETDCFFPSERQDEAADPAAESRWRVRNTLRWKLMVAEEALGAQAICPQLPGGGVQVLGADTLHQANTEAYESDYRSSGPSDVMAAQRRVEEHYTVVESLDPAERDRLNRLPAGVRTCHTTDRVTKPTYLFCAESSNHGTEVVAVYDAGPLEGELPTPRWQFSHDLPADRSLLLHEVEPSPEDSACMLDDADLERAFGAWQWTTERLATRDAFRGTRRGSRRRDSGVSAALDVVDKMRSKRPDHELQTLRDALDGPRWSDEILRGLRALLREASDASEDQRYDLLAEYIEVNGMLRSTPIEAARGSMGGWTLHSWMLLLPQKVE